MRQRNGPERFGRRSSFEQVSLAERHNLPFSHCLCLDPFPSGREECGHSVASCLSAFRDAGGNLDFGTGSRLKPILAEAPDERLQAILAKEGLASEHRRRHAPMPGIS